MNKNDFLLFFKMKLPWCFYIISFIIFVISLLMIFDTIIDVEKNIQSTIDEAPQTPEVLTSEKSDLVRDHKGGAQLPHDKIKMTVDHVLSRFQNLKNFDKNNLADLVIETMVVETLMGKSKYDYASRKYRNYGIAQLREDTAEWMLKKLENNDIDTYAEIMAFYNYDNTLKENLLFNVQFGIAMCAQYYYMRDKNLSNNIKTLSSRSHQWKKNYNTYKGLGTPEIYQSRVDEYYKKHIL